MSYNQQPSGYPQQQGHQQPYGQQGTWNSQPQYGGSHYGQPDYSSAPQQQYGAPQQHQYGAPHQQQQPYGAPPQQQQYGAPPPQQQQYGAPPQQQYGAPPQQQYGAPTSYGQQQHGQPQQGYSNSYATPQAHQQSPGGQHNFFGPQYQVQGQPMVLILTEKKISMGTDSSVMNQSGQILFKFDGKALSLKDKRLLYDQSGQLIATMNQKMFSKHHTWIVSRGQSSQEVFTVQQDDVGSYGGANVYLPGNPKFGVSTANYIVRVQAGGKDFQVQTKSGQLLAETSRHNQFLGSMMGADRYGIVIQPGVDMAFMVCICTAMDDMVFR